jgi:hypothetical protein
MQRSRKIEMVLAVNRTWRDLSESWGKPIEPFDESKLRKPESFEPTRKNDRDSELRSE